MIASAAAPEPALSPAPLTTVAVVGAGTMGAMIAVSLINAGKTAILFDRSEQALGDADRKVAQVIARDVEKGRITTGEGERRQARLSYSAVQHDLAAADLIIEAVFEDMAVKTAVFAELDQIAKPSAILASNTSTLDLDAIAAATARPERVVGLHFFSPAHLMRLVEVVRGAKTSPQALAAAKGLVADLGKVGVVSGVCDGFIGNRIFEEYLRQAYLLVEEGALPQEVDAAMEGFGMAMGPLRTMDLAGQDIGWSIRKRRAISQPDRPYSRLPDKVCELGRFGQKTARGFYLYSDGRTPVVDPQIDALVRAHSAEIGLERRPVSATEIVERCTLAMVNEGARILQEGVAERPSDIDLVYLNGYGFPTARGGPMAYGDSLGLAAVLARIEAYAGGREGWAWTPAPLLVDLARRGDDFASLNG